MFIFAKTPSLMHRIILFSFLILNSFISIVAQNADFETFYEKSGKLKTPSYNETIDYCRKLDKASAQIQLTSFGKSPEGRDLPLVIADQNGNFTPGAVRKSGNVVLLIEACIHAGESDGKDAGLMLLRDIAIHKTKHDLLKHVTILFIPIFNTDGHERFGPYNRINQNGPSEMGWRTTAQNLNLNRDFLKADAPEMQAWLSMFRQWLPDFFIDCHVTDGADFQYTMTYALETKGNMEQRLTDWTRQTCEPYLCEKMQLSGYPIFPYVQFRNWHDPRSGLIMGLAPPMLSQGYTAIQNRPGLLIETHMLKPYQTRVTSTYIMLEHTLNLLNREYQTLRHIVVEADNFTSSKEFREQPFPVSFSENMTDSTTIKFLGFDYTIDTSELTGGLIFKYNNQKPLIWNLTIFPNCKVDKYVDLPKAYLIPPQYTMLIGRLKMHGVKMQAVKQKTECKVRLTIFSDVKWQQRSYEGHHKANYNTKDETVNAQITEGTMLVEINQRTARVIAHLLEPASPDSYAAWGFFDACMEQKEYAESYVMEPLAREMMLADPQLQKEFEQKKATDKSFAENPDAMLNWFYSKTPYWDQKYNVYPIVRIDDQTELDMLRKLTQ